jgi:hypothetical protein
MRCCGGIVAFTVLGRGKIRARVMHSLHETQLQIRLFFACKASSCCVE